jgi:hypothetical protein
MLTDEAIRDLQREVELGQFQSYVRIKESIQMLTLIVSNMEQQFHREEFRADAMQSLRDATSQLGVLVAKLNNPLVSEETVLWQPHRTDVVSVFKRVFNPIFHPVNVLHELKISLPASLIVGIRRTAP